MGIRSKFEKEISLEYSIESISKGRLPETKGQFIFIDNCYLKLDVVLKIFQRRFKFHKFILLRCIVKKRVGIRLIFFSDESISSKCETYYKDLESSNRHIISSLQGPIKKSFHNRAKYFFIKSFCDSGLDMNENNFICSPCCSVDAQSTIVRYFCWRFDYKRMMIEREQARIKAKNMSYRDEVLEICRSGDYSVEFGTHDFDIECINYQMAIVSDFFRRINKKNEPILSPREFWGVE